MRQASWPLTPTDGPAGPLWTTDDVLRWTGTTAVGFVLFAVSWYLAAEQAHSASQIGPANLAVAGLAVFGVANGLWLMRGHRAVRDRARRSAVNPDLSTAVLDDGPLEPARSTAVAEEVLVAAQGVHYHRPDCPMVVDRRVNRASRNEHEHHGRRRCGICRP